MDFNHKEFTKLYEIDKEKFRVSLEYLTGQSIDKRTFKLVERLMKMNRWTPKDIAEYYLSRQRYTKIVNLLQVVTIPNNK